MFYQLILCLVKLPPGLKSLKGLWTVLQSPLQIVEVCKFSPISFISSYLVWFRDLVSSCYSICYSSTRTEEAVEDGRDNEKSNTNELDFFLAWMRSVQLLFHWLQQIILLNLYESLVWIRKKMRFCLHGQTSIFYTCIAERENSRDTEKIFWGKGVSNDTDSQHTIFSRNSNFKKQNIPRGHVGEGLETIQIKCHGL